MLSCVLLKPNTDSGLVVGWVCETHKYYIIIKISDPFYVNGQY